MSLQQHLLQQAQKHVMSCKSHGVLQCVALSEFGCLPCLITEDMHTMRNMALEVFCRERARAMFMCAVALEMMLSMCASSPSQHL